MSQAYVSIPLDLPDVRVLRTEINAQQEFIITLESTKASVPCRLCGGALSKVHSLEAWVVVRHLPVFGRTSYLRYRPRRFDCPTCVGHPTTTETLGWHGGGHSPHTLAYDNHLLLQLVNATVADVSVKEQVAYDRVLGVLERRIAAQVDWAAYTTLPCLGLDEIALQKGHRDFVVIVTARLAHQRVVILGVLADRKKETVVHFLQTIPPPLQATIQTVCCDMWEAYATAAHEVLPTAQVVIDRFHVAEHYHAAADQVRQQELKRLKRTLPQAEYETLRGSLWAFRKRAADLQPTEVAVLERFFTLAPPARQAYQLREQLTAIFDAPLTRDQAATKLQAWMTAVQQTGLKAFAAFCQTLTRWWNDILNYFSARATSGFVEGLNNKLKVLKRRCYGLFNRTHLFQRIYLDLEGFRLFTPPPPAVARSR